MKTPWQTAVKVFASGKFLFFYVLTGKFTYLGNIVSTVTVWLV